MAYHGGQGCDNRLEKAQMSPSRAGDRAVPVLPDRL